MLASTGLPLAPGVWHTTPPGFCLRWCLWGPHQEVTLSILHHTRLRSWAGKGLPLPLWAAEQETKEEMEERVMYADLRFPSTPGNGPPALSVDFLPSCSPLPSPEMSSQTCFPRSLFLGVFSHSNSSSPALLQTACSQGGGQEGLRGRECPLHPHATAQTSLSLLSPPSIVCREIISRTVKLQQTGSLPLFPGFPTAS